MAPEIAKATSAAVARWSWVVGRVSDCLLVLAPWLMDPRHSAARPAVKLHAAAAVIVSDSPSRPISTNPDSRQPAIAPAVLTPYSTPIARVSWAALTVRAPRTASGR